MSPSHQRPPLFRSSARGFLALRRLVGALALGLSVADPAGALTVEPSVPALRGKVDPPVATRRVSPVHPPELVKELVNGEAVVECVVGQDGSVRNIKTFSASHPAFGPAAEEALGKWEFKPGKINGEPADVRIRVPFEFKLPPDQVLGVIAGRPIYAEITETIIPASQLPAWPRPIEFYIPRYPPEFEGTGKYGKAVINITIDKEGKVMNPRLVKATYPEFVIPALVTALKLKFPPQVMADNKAVHVNMDIQFDFKVPSKVTVADRAKADAKAAADKAKADAKAEKTKAKPAK